ncbi:hypothetical protein DID88_007167 [Monilinia fructigena]|uniref:Uncharacterized protein n=1 Tax=Monilinia fructigena TaxID=38457 RepID=A0A395J8H9_9HELO|nr:hypothetical protein DID88_007167 [Monilinia fructigena]
MASNPPLSDQLFTNVDITKGSETVSGLQLPTGGNYQINFGVASSASSTLAGYTGSVTTGTSTSTSTGASTTVTGTSTSTESSSSTGTGLVTSASGSKTSSASASKTSTASGNGAAATGVPMIGLLAGAAALFL